jgi:hypothetical protein
MPTMRPEDVAAMFDLPPLAEPESSTQAAEAAAAEEAALAAELAASLESGEFADDAPDSRADHRVEVAWPARLRLPDGRAIALEVRNVSESGVGLVSDERIPADIVAVLEMDVPSPGANGDIVPVKGTIKTTYTVAQGAETLCGGTWQVPPAGLELVSWWIERLRA